MHSQERVISAGFSVIQQHYEVAVQITLSLPIMGGLSWTKRYQVLSQHTHSHIVSRSEEHQPAIVRLASMHQSVFRRGSWQDGFQQLNPAIKKHPVSFTEWLISIRQKVCS